MKKIKTKKTDEIIIKPDDLVTVTKMGNITEIQHMEKMNTRQTIQKISKHQYVVLETGEVKDFELSANRSENINSLRKTMKKMRYLINNNFYGKKNELALTLTYEENMTDTKRLEEDLESFIDKLRYRYKGKTKIEYMHVIEPQGRGAWHSHTLLRFDDLKYIYIPNDEIRKMWGQGIVKVKHLNNVDNIGAYLTAYLTDIEFTDENVRLEHIGSTIEEKEVNGVKKQFIKGGRLFLYPPGMNLFRKSNGIKYPKRENMKYKDAKKEVGFAEPNFSSVTKIETDDFKNTISFEEYNSKRN